MKKNLFYLICITLCLVTLAVDCVCAWFIFAQRSIIIYSGDMQITVDGYYDIISSEEVPLYETPLSSRVEENLGLDDLDINERVAYKFVVTNDSSYEGALAISFGDFCHFMFEQYNEYYQYCQTYYTANGVLPTEAQLPSQLAADITQLATRNTAKLTLVIESAYYTVGNSHTPINIANNDMNLWKYATGEDFLTDIPLAPNDYITVYFTILNKQSSSLISPYEQWVLGSVNTVSYPQNAIANQMGYTYEGLSLQDKSIVDNYLRLFYVKELEAANPSSDVMSILKLELPYIKFTAQST